MCVTPDPCKPEKVASWLRLRSECVVSPDPCKTVHDFNPLRPLRSECVLSDPCKTEQCFPPMASPEVGNVCRHLTHASQSSAFLPALPEVGMCESPLPMQDMFDFPNHGRVQICVVTDPCKPEKSFPSFRLRGRMCVVSDPCKTEQCFPPWLFPLRSECVSLDPHASQLFFFISWLSPEVRMCVSHLTHASQKSSAFTHGS
jgi:hypothetical protein